MRGECNCKRLWCLSIRGVQYLTVRRDQALSGYHRYTQTADNVQDMGDTSCLNVYCSTGVSKGFDGFLYDFGLNISFIHICITFNRNDFYLKKNILKAVEMTLQTIKGRRIAQHLDAPPPPPPLPPLTFRAFVWLKHVFQGRRNESSKWVGRFKLKILYALVSSLTLYVRTIL